MQVGFSIGIGEDGLSLTAFATELTHDSLLMTDSSYYFGIGGAVGGGISDAYQGDSFFSTSSGENKVIAGGGGLIISAGASAAVGDTGVSGGVGKLGAGIGFYFAEGKQHYGTARFNW
jgi:hypothetical protein